MKKIIILSVFFFAIVFSLILTNLARQRDAFAVEACNDYPTEALKQQCNDIENQIRQYEAKLDETRKKEGDIKQNIDYLDNQIYLSKLRIQESEIIIEKRKQDIENLINNIMLLEESLNKNTKLFLRRVNLSYRQGNLKPYMVFFGSGNIADKMSKFKYLQIVQSADRQFLFKIQETKNSYASQKKLVETEKKALEEENKQLEDRKAILAEQVQEKEVVLAQTQSEASVLSATIESLRAQRDSLYGGVGALGYTYGTSGCKTWSEDNNYYNQTDCRWAGVEVGSRSYGGSYDSSGAYDSYVGNIGCLITSVSMTLKKYGKGTNPQIIASDPSFFAKDSAGNKTDLMLIDINSALSKYGLSQRSIGWGDVRQKINDGKWVIINVPMVTSFGHWVVITRWDDSINDFRINDPYYGPDLPMHQYYSTVYAQFVIE